jgi:ribonuclease HI
MFICYFDGACLPKNPGGIPSYGWVITNEGKEIENGYGKLSDLCEKHRTNNAAEYAGLLNLLRRLDELCLKNCLINGDSQLVINMASSKWGKDKPHDGLPHLLEPLLECRELVKKGEHHLKWIPREQNFRADELSKKASGYIG